MTMVIHDLATFDPKEIFCDTFVDQLPAEVYHATPAISKSGLDLIDKSAAHYHNAPQRVATRAMELGTATHIALLEPAKFDDEYLIVPAKDRRQKEWKDAVAQVGSEHCLLLSEAESIIEMQRSIAKHDRANRLVESNGWRELSGFARDPETGVLVRCRFDLLTETGTAVDLKTTRDARSHEFSRSVASFRYHVQAALYSDLYYWITGERLESFRFLAVETAHPYTVCHYVLDDEAIAQGRREYRENLNTYARCLETGKWPQYEPETEWLSLPSWKMAEIEAELEVAL
ncbi:MAG: PD-(D/E)XK nuclease-like domain-containing protein [Wenzhouxiangella sp.]